MWNFESYVLSVFIFFPKTKYRSCGISVTELMASLSIVLDIKLASRCEPMPREFNAKIVLLIRFVNVVLGASIACFVVKDKQNAYENQYTKYIYHFVCRSDCRSQLIYTNYAPYKRYIQTRYIYYTKHDETLVHFQYNNIPFKRLLWDVSLI